MFGSVFISSLGSGTSIIIIFMVVAIAALISERAGIINIGLEGQMVFAAFGYAWVTSSNYNFNNLSNHALAMGAIIVAIIFGMIISFLHSLMVLKFKIDHIIAGTVINVAGIALASFGAILLTGRATISTKIQYLPLSIGNVALYPFLLLILVVAIVAIINFTKYGLRLKSVGENPWAGQSVGINVIRYKFWAITISGALAGLGGALYVISQDNFTPTAGGYGFIAIAIMILARWNGWFVILSSIIFGYIFAFTYEAASIQSITQKISPLLLRSLLFLTPLISLVIFRIIYNKKLSSAPQALGIIFSKTQ